MQQNVAFLIRAKEQNMCPFDLVCAIWIAIYLKKWGRSWPSSRQIKDRTHIDGHYNTLFLSVSRHLKVHPLRSNARDLRVFK